MRLIRFKKNDPHIPLFRKQLSSLKDPVMAECALEEIEELNYLGFAVLNDEKELLAIASIGFNIGSLAKYTSVPVAGNLYLSNLVGAGKKGAKTFVQYLLKKADLTNYLITLTSPETSEKFWTKFGFKEKHLPSFKAFIRLPRTS